MGTNLNVIALSVLELFSAPSTGVVDRSALANFDPPTLGTAVPGSLHSFDKHFLQLQTGTASILSEVQQTGSQRATTEREEIIGALREWALFNANWDGEGADAPKLASLKDATQFVRMLGEDFALLPAPMLLASGHAGLYWNYGGLYADLEFLGDRRVTYFIERQGEGKHKGVVQIREDEMPAVFAALLRV